MKIMEFKRTYIVSIDVDDIIEDFKNEGWELNDISVANVAEQGFNWVTSDFDNYDDLTDEEWEKVFEEVKKEWYVSK